MTEDTAQGFSRRNFIKGVIAAGAAASSSARYLFRTDAAARPALAAPGASNGLITLNVNGQERRVDVMKQETLAMTLRYKLGLTGTKLGLRPRRVRRLHRAGRRCAALFVLDADAHRAWQEDGDHRRPGAPPTARCTRCSRPSSTNRASSARSACRAS